MLNRTETEISHPEAANTSAAKTEPTKQRNILAKRVKNRGAPIQRQGRVGRLVLHVALALFAAAFIAPLILVISSSLSSEAATTRDGYSFIPREFSTFAYQFILSNPLQLLQAYGVSIVVTGAGTVLSLTVMSLLAYTLAQQNFRLRKPLAFIVMFTMLFNGGLVPIYILVTQYLHLQNTLLALILPYLVAPWYVLLLRTYFTQLPTEILDAARVDGASEWSIYWRIVLPLSKPALATVGLFMLLLYWNDWWLGLLYITNNDLVPVQLYLYRILSNIDFIAASPELASQIQGVPIQTVRMAASVLAIGPIVIAFFAVQRFLVKGITVGGLKE